MVGFVSYAHPDNLGVRFKDLKTGSVPNWAVHVKDEPASVTLGEVKNLSAEVVLALLAQTQGAVKTDSGYIGLDGKPWAPLRDVTEASKIAAKYELTVDFKYRTVSDPHGANYVYDTTEDILLAIARVALFLSTQ